MLYDVVSILPSHCPHQFSHPVCIEGHFWLVQWEEVGTILYQSWSSLWKSFPTGSPNANIHSDKNVSLSVTGALVKWAEVFPFLCFSYYNFLQNSNNFLDPEVTSSFHSLPVAGYPSNATFTHVLFSTVARWGIKTHKWLHEGAQVTQLSSGINSRTADWLFLDLKFCLHVDLKDKNLLVRCKKRWVGLRYMLLQC